MRVVVQRVAAARVVVAGEPIAAIGRGLLLLVGLAIGDSEAEIAWMARKLSGLRIFADAAGLMNAALADVGGAVLAVPNFTLLGDCRKGKRPSFANALAPEIAQPLFARFVELLTTHVGSVATGRFGVAMDVELVNDGPVTLVVET
ncbi:MAG: D-tyrosyl-tRNA(Tyr) deacylase [Deltaproteobacteria bacterium]|nr:D-tyrosyl-tRNA(Tyr) deacylase [Deltaproteobacteria bacterium]